MPDLALGCRMPDFVLDEPATGRKVASKELPPHDPVVVVFTSNHCPHSLAWEERILQLGRDYQGRVSMVLISANDPDQVPECSPDALAERARDRKYPMPYLFDLDQNVALSYDAERTPDIFVFDAARRLVYHGTVDDNEEEPDKVKTSYARDAVAAAVDGTPVPIAETPLLGCGIKWKPGSVGSIRYATKLISRGTWSDADLASALAYEDEAQFATRFGEVTGQTPEEFRATLTP